MLAVSTVVFQFFSQQNKIVIRTINHFFQNVRLFINSYAFE